MVVRHEGLSVTLSPTLSRQRERGFVLLSSWAETFLHTNFIVVPLFFPGDLHGE
jgi:hypothetical protein